MKVPIKFYASLSLAIFLTLVFLFQNCSDISLTKISDNSVFDFKVKDSICSIPAISNRDKIKFLFVIDMSASNQSVHRVAPNGTVIDVKGSDLLSERIQAIEDFLQQDCIANNTNSKIAVTGFAHTDILYPGTSCNKNQFKSFDQIQPVLNFYRNEDQQVHQDCINGTGKCTQYTTNYDDAVTCASNIVNHDIQNPDPDDKKSFYMTFFLTDGEPFTSYPAYELGTSNYNSFKNTITNKVRNMRQNAEQNALGLLLQPIFYGADYLQRKDPSGQKQLLADDILSAMANEGMTEYRLLDFASELNLCDYLVSGNRVPYELKHFVVTNLTATKRGPLLLADSDMDGIPDIHEVERGFDPTRPRSMYDSISGTGSLLLDGACGGLNAEQCKSSTYANCGEPNKLGITICEVDKLGLTNGIDSNDDGFLDIMRLIKGLSPNAVSAFVDGDSLTEAEELRVGRDPRYPDDDTPDNLLVKVEMNYRQEPLEGCPIDQEAIDYNIIQMPLVRTLRTNATDPISQQIPWLHHDKDENVILIYYILTPANSDLRGILKDQVYAKFLKVNFFGFMVEESEFKKVGELHSNFYDSME